MQPGSVRKRSSQSNGPQLKALRAKSRRTASKKMRKPSGKKLRKKTSNCITSWKRTGKGESRKPGRVKRLLTRGTLTKRQRHALKRQPGRNSKPKPNE